MAWVRVRTECCVMQLDDIAVGIGGVGKNLLNVVCDWFQANG